MKKVNEATVDTARRAGRHKGVKARAVDLIVITVAFTLIHFALYTNVPAYEDFWTGAGELAREGVESVANAGGGGTVRLSSETHGYAGLLDPFTIEPGFYQYVTTGFGRWATHEWAKVDAHLKPPGCMPGEYHEAFARRSVGKTCTIWLTINNPDKVEWSITIAPEHD